MQSWNTLMHRDAQLTCKLSARTVYRIGFARSESRRLLVGREGARPRAAAQRATTDIASTRRSVLWPTTIEARTNCAFRVCWEDSAIAAALA